MPSLSNSAPGFLAEDVHSESMGDWYPILLITAYNVGDAVGKGGPLVLPSVAPRAVLLLSLLRFLFIPAFILSAAYAAPAWVRPFPARFRAYSQQPLFVFFTA